MRRILLLSGLTLTALATAALAQITGVKGIVGNKLDNAVEEHNQDVNNAINGTENKPPPAPPQPGELKTGWITRKSKGVGADLKDVRLYFAYPANLTKASPVPALVVLQEWWGVNEDIQQRTQEFARKGMYAIAPDLFYGKVTDDPAEAAKLKDAMTDNNAMIAMKTALDLTDEETKNGVIKSEHVGVIGWCMGGQQALILATTDPRIHATCIFYGPLITDQRKLNNLQGPLLGIFGNNDTAPSRDDVNKFEQAMKSNRKSDFRIFRFDGVGHAFASKSAEKLGLYNAEAAQKAWAETWSWLDQNMLKKK